MTLNESIVRSRLFFSGFLVLLSAGIIMLLTFGKTVSFISLNSFHPFSLNVFFINYTFIGDGIFALCLVALLFIYKKKQQALVLFISFLFSGLLVQVIKNLIRSPRPKLFFEPGQYLHFIDGISIANNSSFPSGHTATAFAIATAFVLILKNKNLQFPILIAAAMVGYSRIYLAQHFLLDVLIGAAIGVLSGILSVFLVLNAKSIRRSVHKIKSGETDRELLSIPVCRSVGIKNSHQFHSKGGL